MTAWGSTSESIFNPMADNQSPTEHVAASVELIVLGYTLAPLSAK
jgi:hypothetical protein